ncbi:hypothetical protein RvY_05311 [Ramazzottius varieornatus]|uniref:DEP domain-containing protein n=1 Tax=Ramazzottius varieornatus TaxID=947166 RepID=A0A1D1V4F0_RAMVA|nr:hypothetical protein RvY_05311 [Ramazzottius varieornatus]
MDLDHLAEDFEVLAIGEQLRYRMHLAPNLVKERRHNLNILKTYKCCFVANETLDWLIEENEAPSRQAALFLMNILQHSSIIHHVSDSAVFKDQPLLFRFRQDDSTFPATQVTRLFFFGQRLFDRLHSEPGSCLRTKPTSPLGSALQRDSFRGCDFTQWLIKKGEARSLEDALVACQQLLDCGLLHWVDGANSSKFKNSDMLYRFAFDFNYKRRLHDLFLLPNVQKQAALQNIKFLPKLTSAYEIYPGFDENGSKSPVSFSDASSHGSTSPTVATNPYRPPNPYKPTKEHILEPDSGYVRKFVQVESDAVGYGFVLRGASPCHIQTVDPDGPAFKAGIKVGQFLYSVNDFVVFEKSHKDVASKIVESNGKIRLVVYAPPDQ